MIENIWKIVSKPDNVPIVIMLILVAYFTWLSFREAFRNDRLRFEEGMSLKEATLGDEVDAPAKVFVWPHLLRLEMLAAMVTMVILLYWSIGLHAPLEDPANPNITPNPSKAPWYFLGLQEILVYFDPWIAGVVLPNLIIVGLLAIPYIDMNPKGNGYYTWRERPFAISVFLFGFLFLWCSLVAIGTFVRGPGWIWFWPWEHWDAHRVISQTNIDLTDLWFGIPSTSATGSLIGMSLIGLYFLLCIVLPMAFKGFRESTFYRQLGLPRYLVTASLAACMLSLPIKMILRIGFNVKYVWVTPWFNV